MNILEITAALSAVGYYADAATAQAAAAVLVPRPDKSVRSLILTGVPGCGKSSLAPALAQVTKARLVEYQAHPWTDADELFVGVDVAAVVEGNAKNVRQPGVLSIASTLSQTGDVVLLIDELDKAKPAAENLLLGWLQTAACQTRPGEHVRGDPNRIVVVLTSNGERPIGGALARRCRHLTIEVKEGTWIPAVSKIAGISPKSAAALWRVCQNLPNPPAPGVIGAWYAEVSSICSTWEQTAAAWTGHVGQGVGNPPHSLSQWWGTEHARRSS